MSEEQNEQSKEPVESTETTESNEPSTIADVATKFNVEQKSTEFQTQSVPEATEPSEPEYSYDPEMQKVAAHVTNLTKEISEIKQAATDDRLNRDIKQAVSEITKQVELPGSNPDLTAEIYLEKRYREDSNFKNIWDGRYTNPDALAAASKIIANDMAKDFNIQVNDQLVENVRAAKKSQSTSATAPAEATKTEEMMNMSSSEFDREWARIKG